MSVEFGVRSWGTRLQTCSSLEFRTVVDPGTVESDGQPGTKRSEARF